MERWSVVSSRKEKNKNSFMIYWNSQQENETSCFKSRIKSDSDKFSSLQVIFFSPPPPQIITLILFSSGRCQKNTSAPSHLQIGPARLTVTVKWSPGSANGSSYFPSEHLIDTTELVVWRYWKCKEIDGSREARHQSEGSFNWRHLTGDCAN